MKNKAYYKLWGKANRENERWHPLVCHMLDVAAVAREVLNREPESTRNMYASDFGLQWEYAEGWALFFIALHDIGKATPSFQKMCENKLPSLRSLLFEHGFEWDENITYVHHGQLGQFILERELDSLLNIDADAIDYVIRAINDHHGYHEELNLSNNLRNCGLKQNQATWKEARQEMIVHLKELYIKKENKPDFNIFNGPSYIRLAGLTSFSDWIGSNIDYFPYISDKGDVSLEKYWEQAIDKACNALNSIGWKKRVNLYNKLPLFKDVCFGENKYDPRPLQEAIESVISQCNGPSLILMEAPTGEGKTEAALYAHIALQLTNQHRGLYVALPSQATGDAMFKRTLNFLSKCRQDVYLDLQLIHGAAILNDEFQKLQLLSIYDGNESDSIVSSHKWFTYKKRSLLSEYGVGTIDQALISVLNVKHGFVRLWGLGNRTVIIDEVHAYDVYTSTILDRLLQWLKALSSSVIIMSATLPSKRREELLEAWGVKKTESFNYPRLITVDEKGYIIGAHFSIDEKRKIEIKIKPAPIEINDLSLFALKIIQKGGCLAIIVNTVQRAQDLYRCIKDINKDAEIYLFHARYPAGLRKQKEEQVENLFGKPGKNYRRPERSILIATQVVEQSLDLDFDVMISDLAPVDLLLQRAGRLHRHARPVNVRFNHQTPCLFVCGMGGESPPEIGKPLYWGKIYYPYILYRTWIILGTELIVNLIDSTDEIIEKVYGDVFLQSEWTSSEEYIQARTDMEQAIDEDRSVINSLIGKPYGEEWANPSGLIKMDDGDIMPGAHLSLYAKTRKGDRSITLIILFRKNEKLYLDEDGVEEVDLNSEIDISVAKKFISNGVSISRKDVYNHFININIPEIWKKNSLLRHCRPLVLENHLYTTEKIIIGYNNELGVYYEQKN